jgi:hypothetical protein
MKLTRSDIDRVNLPRATTQKYVGKSAGRSPEIKADLSGRIETEMRKRCREFYSPARNKRMRGRSNQFCVRRKRLGGLFNLLPVGGHETRLNRRLRPRAALE